MKLGKKIVLAIGLVWLLFFALIFVGSHEFLLTSFIELEKNHTNDDLDRVDGALEQIENSLMTFTADWSHWNDVYAYLQGINPNFIPNNLLISALVNVHVNFLSFWDKNGHLLAGLSLNGHPEQFTAYPIGLENYINESSPILTQLVATHGFIFTDHGIMLLASDTITDGNRSMPALGLTIAGRYLDQALVQQIANTTKMALALFLPADMANSPLLLGAFQLASASQDDHYFHVTDRHTLAAYSVIRDIHHQPIGMLRIIRPRTIYLTGETAIYSFLAVLVVLGVLFSLLLFWLIRLLIIKRLEKLDNDVVTIGQSQAIAKRVDATGNDELSSVSNKINNMLDIIQASHDRLEQRVEDRTKELHVTNKQLKQEITERKSVERQLTINKEHLVRLAHYDNVTSLPNRVFFNEILNKAINNAKRNKKLLAVLFIDLDRFKNINDALGHGVGDTALKEIGQRFANTIRSGDILARLGGDEFIVLLNDIDDEKYAGYVADKIIAICSQPIIANALEFFINASIGISIYPQDGDSLEELEKNADMAMYKAKNAGGGVYHYYTHEMDIAAHEYVKLEAALRKAVQNNEFALYFQPQLNLKENTINHVEALIRWNSPEMGLINPSRFIPLAEKTGLIMPIGEWAIREACRINKGWQDEGYDPITVAVNISPKQFHHQDVVKIVTEALSESKLDAKYLEVEITESAVMENIDLTIGKLNAIHAMGVRISIDDFGTGYTSINYLRQFPVNVLKIDQTFIKGIPHNQNDVAITSAVIALGHNLGLEIIAEGVENTEQIQYLVDNHCDMIQGYFLSRPLPASKIVQQFTKGGKKEMAETP